MLDTAHQTLNIIRVDDLLRQRVLIIVDAHLPDAFALAATPVKAINLDSTRSWSSTAQGPELYQRRHPAKMVE